MNERTVLLWLEILRDSVIPISIAVLTYYFKAKWGIDIQEGKKRQNQTKALDSIFIARKAARSSSDPTPNTPEGIEKKAVEVGQSQVKTSHQEEIATQIRAILAKIEEGFPIAQPEPTPSVVVVPAALSQPPPRSPFETTNE